MNDANSVAGPSPGATVRAGILRETRERMGEHFTPRQILGRTQTIGCVALEVTQRCNLDCSLCYLSEHSESVRDLPIEEIFHRIDRIRAHYGPGTNVQITGGEPTLRKHHELLSIVRYARTAGLQPALFTNGIGATRRLLGQLAQAGLADVAFHVDTSQKRPGFRDESSLNAVRREYMERARGLGLMIVFNTTVHDGNIHEVPDLVRFFIGQADAVGFASFQLQAETGRGEWGRRGPSVSLESVRAHIDNGAGRTLPWDLVRIGHPRCHSYVPLFIINGHAYPVIDDERLLADYLADFAALPVVRGSPCLQTIVHHLWAAQDKPRWYARALWFMFGHVRRAWRDLIQARGRVHKLSFFVQNFMDSGTLDAERVNACSFMVMSPDGPVSMCAHNARRDDYILQPIEFRRPDGSRETFIPVAHIGRKSPRAAAG